MADWRAIAWGGFAIVWEARQESLNRLVAVKVDERKLETEAEQRHGLREAGAAGRMSGHRGIWDNRKLIIEGDVTSTKAHDHEGRLRPRQHALANNSNAGFNRGPVGVPRPSKSDGRR